MPNSVPPDYADRIKALRRSLDLTQVRLAELMGVSFQSVNRWENGASRPSPLAWQQIARAEQVGIDGLGGPASRRAIREPLAEYAAEAVGIPDIDFLADPEAVREVAEAERLAYGHLFNPAFATEISLIDPLPHQRIAVYDRMLTQPRLRFLLADDAGAGKTIMAGLYIREMLSRRLIRRVLVVPPAGLVGNWERELRTLFNLSFTIVLGGDARSSNPFVGPDGDLVIISVDTLAANRAFERLQEPDVLPYDLVIFDEAHKLSADRELDFRVRKTDRYRLAEALAGAPNLEPRWQLNWSANHVILLTATPHMGKDYPYYALWRLLEPEALSTIDAFNAYPADARQRHFIRRTKEEMVRFDGTPIYPTRVSDTLSYDLSLGEASEQTLYDETTNYIQTYYNRARILNRSAARLAMSVFQRRLASSTYALLRSFERRLAKLDALIDDIRSGRITLDQLFARQDRLNNVTDIFNEKTADEETAADGFEENETVEDQAAGAFVARSLDELEVEQTQVERLVDLAHRVYDQGSEAKFDKLREVLRKPEYENEKFIIFTEHRDTLWFLVRRLEGLGFTGQIAQIHGAMDYREREEQVELFRTPLDQGGARYLIATDAAGEGINLQFCWLMVNYDIPWNPARLEQRMGRIHRYGQKHDPVIIINLVAGKTREGRVLRTLLKKLEAIRKELGSDKVFDVIGRLFEGVSLAEFLSQALSDEGADEAGKRIDGTLTAAQVRAIEVKEQRLLGDGGDVKAELPSLKRRLEGEELRRLLPGYVRQFIARATPLLGIQVEGDLDKTFALRPARTGALDPIWPILETYLPERRERLTVYRPRNGEDVIFLHPGEPVFERLRSWVLQRFGRDALRGAAFVDPNAEKPYLFHLALVEVERQADLAFAALNQREVLEYRLVGLRQEENGQISTCPVEYLLLLRGGSGIPVSAARVVVGANELRDAARAYALSDLATPLAERHRKALVGDLSARSDFVARGYDFQDAELAALRTRLTERSRAGDTWATGELTKTKARQRELAARREQALTTLRREPELVACGDVSFLAHALVVPSDDPADRMQHDQEVEQVAVRVARAFEESHQAVVRDVSTPPLARAARLEDYPGFDLLSRRPDGSELAIEVKGRAGIGDVELKENEWAKACNLGERYWLYVVYDCAGAHPRLLRVQDPFRKLIVRAKGGVLIGEREVFASAE